MPSDGSVLALAAVSALALGSALAPARGSAAVAADRRWLGALVVGDLVSLERTGARGVGKVVRITKPTIRVEVVSGGQGETRDFSRATGKQIWWKGAKLARWRITGPLFRGSASGTLAAWFPWHNPGSLREGYPPIGEPDARGALYLSTNRTKTRVNVEHGTLVDPRVHVALRYLVDQAPELADADLSIDNTPPGVNVGDVLDAGWRDVTRRLPLLYHGTSTALLPRIEAFGLRPREQTRVDPTYSGAGQDKPSQPGLVYFGTLDALGGPLFASAAAARKHGGQRVILIVDPSGLDRSKLEPDEDAAQGVSAYVRHGAEPMASWPKWAQSLARMGTVAYRGKIDPKYVSVYRTIS